MDGVSLPLSPGLTCVIGARGSGKSTLALALRYAVLGPDGANKARQDLLKANLGRSVMNVRLRRSDGAAYAIRREGKGIVVLTTEDGHALPSVDLERGTFLPLDAYSSGEIEEIANESLGPRRRSLLDQLHAVQLQSTRDEIAESLRELDANADEIRAIEREISSLNEQTLVLSDAPARLAAIEATSKPAAEFNALQAAARQDQTNIGEQEAVEASGQTLSRLKARSQDLLTEFSRILQPLFAQPGSTNRDLTTRMDEVRSGLVRSLENHVASLRGDVDRAEREMLVLGEELAKAHLQQSADYVRLRQANEAAGEAAKERAEAEKAAQRLGELQASLKAKQAELASVRASRVALRTRYHRLGDRVSDLRGATAATLQEDAGPSVHVSVRRAADRSEYIQLLIQGLRGAGVSRHESIVDAVAKLRPDELASVLSTRNYGEFEAITGIESERARKVLDAFRGSLDPLSLETMRPDDMVGIELNVGGEGREVFRDASRLSQGQKCTALLPLLLARRSAPLIIDQPEDNLDNHFIYETVVKSILRMKGRRQMVFITHNANIPVLAEAELVIVLGSDGERGRVEKTGTLDECRQEIVDLLEGGQEAFELRRERYGR